jgi:iron(III) transport system substrate-binding protein
MGNKDSGRALAVALVVTLAVAGPAVAATPAPTGPTPAMVSAAEKEGTVVWYSTMETKDLDNTVQAFQRKYPRIKLQTLRLGSAQLPVRVITEQRGGKYNADVLSGDGFQVAQLVSAGALEKYRIPDTGKFLPFTTDPNGYWVDLYQNTTVIAWNPQRLQADQLAAPHDVTDLANPGWKGGKIGIDGSALNWYVGTLQVEKNGNQLMQRLAANKPVITAGHTVTMTQLEAGEFDATPTVYGYYADQEKRAGRPVDWINPKPLLVTLNPVGLAKNAPHPNAARVLIDWLTSKEGQQFLASQGGGEISSRVDVKSNPRVWNPKDPYIVVPAPDPAKYNEDVQNFKTTFGIATLGG